MTFNESFLTIVLVLVFAVAIYFFCEVVVGYNKQVKLRSENVRLKSDYNNLEREATRLAKKVGELRTERDELRGEPGEAYGSRNELLNQDDELKKCLRKHIGNAELEISQIRLIVEDSNEEVA